MNRVRWERALSSAAGLVLFAVQWECAVELQQRSCPDGPEKPLDMLFPWKASLILSEPTVHLLHIGLAGNVICIIPLIKANDCKECGHLNFSLYNLRKAKALN